VGLTGVGPNRLHADAQYISLLGKKDGSFLSQSGSVGSIFFEVDVVLGVRPLRPVCTQEKLRACGDTAVRFFPLSNMLQGQPIVWFFATPALMSIPQPGPTNLFGGLRVHGVVWKVFPKDPMDWSIKMGASRQPRTPRPPQEPAASS